MLDNLMKKMKGGKKTDEADDQSVESETVEAEDQAPKKEKPKTIKEEKKSNPIIKIIIVLGIAYFAYDEFLVEKPTPEDETKAAQVAKADSNTKRKKKLKREEEASAPEVASDVAQNSSEPKTDSSNGLASLDVGTGSAEKSSEENSTSTVSNTLDDSMTNAISEVEIEAQKKKDETMATAPVEEINISKTIGEIEKEPVADVPISQLNGEEIKTPQLENKIDETSEYTEPPKYEILGRGLVYNCKGKHWACVDKTNYQICHKNMKHNEANGKASECVTQNVYSNEEDCSTVQRYNVSTSVATNFCKN